MQGRFFHKLTPFFSKVKFFEKVKESKSLLVFFLKSPVRFLRESSYSPGPDWSLINWRFRTAQDFLALIGAYPDVAYRKGLISIHRLGVSRADLVSIDLIPAGISDKKISDKKSEVWERKVERAKKRLEKRESCGKSGHIVLAIKREGGKAVNEVRYYPHRCHSVLCPYCSYENFRETFARHYEVFEAWHRANKRLAFWTLTIRSFDNPADAVEFSFKALEKLYQFRLGVRNWKKVRKLFAKEVLSYYRSLKGGGDKLAYLKARRQIRYFKKFEGQVEPYLKQGLKFGQLFNAMWKFEITYTAKGWHPHWHGIVDSYIPKLLLTVIWRLATGGLGEITDVRRVARGKKGLIELTKYITKHWELEGLSFEQLVELEAVLIGRKKFRVWGFEILELEKEKDEEEYVGFWSIQAELKYRKNLHEIPKLIRRMRREGIKEARIDRLIIYDERSGVWEVDLWLREDGKLIIKDKVFTDVIYGYADLIAIFGSYKTED